MPTRCCLLPNNLWIWGRCDCSPVPGSFPCPEVVPESSSSPFKHFAWGGLSLLPLLSTFTRDTN